MPTVIRCFPSVIASRPCGAAIQERQGLPLRPPGCRVAAPLATTGADQAHSGQGKERLA